MTGWAFALDGAKTVLTDLAGFAAWLGIHPTPQDFTKAIILVIFVFAILMVVGDVYRGDIQNKVHRIKLVATAKKGSPTVRAEISAEEVRRRARIERDFSIHVPQAVVGVTLDNVFTNTLFYLRYRDFRGKLRAKLVGDYRTRLKVHLQRLSSNLANGLENQHVYTDEESDHFVNEDPPEIVSMAASRVDYLTLGIIEPFEASLQRQYEQFLKSRFHRWRAGVTLHQLKKPEQIGLVAKFHFPINPYFLLYRHPEMNVRTTAWLTVLTSIFALFMQILYETPELSERGKAHASGEREAHAQSGEDGEVATAQLTARAPATR